MENWIDKAEEWIVGEVDDEDKGHQPTCQDRLQSRKLKMEKGKI